MGVASFTNDSQLTSSTSNKTPLGRIRSGLVADICAFFDAYHPCKGAAIGLLKDSVLWGLLAPERNSYRAMVFQIFGQVVSRRPQCLVGHKIA